MVSVLIAVPNLGTIDTLLSQRIVQMILDQRHRVVYQPVQGRPRDVARSKIMRLMLTGSYDFLVMIDSDNPPMANVLELVDFNKPVICCPTPFIVPASPEPFAIGWNVWVIGEDGELCTPPMRDELFPIEDCGAGCLIIRRDVIETLGIGAFASTVNPETGISNDDDDTAFCKKCHKAEIPIYAHGGYLCRHRKTADLYDVLEWYEAKDAHKDYEASITLKPDEWRDERKPLAVSQVFKGVANAHRGCVEFGPDSKAITQARERSRVETQNACDVNPS